MHYPYFSCILPKYHLFANYMLPTFCVHTIYTTNMLPTSYLYTNIVPICYLSSTQSLSKLATHMISIYCLFTTYSLHTIPIYIVPAYYLKTTCMLPIWNYNCMIPKWVNKLRASNAINVTCKTLKTTFLVFRMNDWTKTMSIETNSRWREEQC